MILLFPYKFQLGPIIYGLNWIDLFGFHQCQLYIYVMSNNILQDK